MKKIIVTVLLLFGFLQLEAVATPQWIQRLIHMFQAHQMPSPTPTVSPTPTPVQGNKTFATGIYSWDAQSHDPTLTSANPLINNPDIDGFRLKFRWSDLEPTLGVFNFGPVTSSILVAQAHGKGILLSVSAGKQSPGFIYPAGGGVCNPFVFQVRNPDDSTMWFTWQVDCQHYWDDFVHAFVAQFDTNPTVRGLYVSGKGEFSLEFYVCKIQSDVDEYEAAALAGGYADTGFGAKSNALRAGATHVMNTWNTSVVKTPTEFTTASPWDGGANQAGSTADNTFCVNYWKGQNTHLHGQGTESFHATQTHTDIGLVLSYPHGQEAVDSMHGRLGLGIYTQPQPDPLPADPIPMYDFLQNAYEDGAQHVIVFQEDLVQSVNASTIHSQRAKILTNTP